VNLIVRRLSAVAVAQPVVVGDNSTEDALMNIDSDSGTPEVYQDCPICGASLRQNLRYPFMLCGACVDQATDKSGRSLEFANIDATGGFQAFYSDSGEPYLDHVCFILGVRCCADEAHFGGIVVQPINPTANPNEG
jgi:hypothetical protein